MVVVVVVAGSHQRDCSHCKSNQKQLEDDNALKRPETSFEEVSSICSFGQGYRSKSRLSFNLITTPAFSSEQGDS